MISCHLSPWRLGSQGGDLGDKAKAVPTIEIPAVFDRLALLVHRLGEPAAVDALVRFTRFEQEVYEREIGEKRESFEYGAGCNYCAGTGYRGRVAVFELLVMNDELRRLVIRNANSDEIREAAIRSGMRTMLKDGMLKVKQGITTPTEGSEKI